jgi:Ca2+-binding EF-hand superfamily protein
MYMCVNVCVNVCVLLLLSGLVLSLLMEAPEDKSIFEKIVAGVTEEEIEFMKIFEIDDGDGTIDSKEFIILTVVRIGAAPPQLINQIHARFDILDRQHTGKIKYDDLIVGRQKRVKSLRGILKSMSSKNMKLSVDTALDDPKKNETMSLLNAKLERTNRSRGLLGSHRISPSNSMTDLHDLNNGLSVLRSSNKDGSDQFGSHSPHQSKRSNQVIHAPACYLEDQCEIKSDDKDNIDGYTHVDIETGRRERSMTQTEVFVESPRIAFQNRSRTESTGSEGKENTDVESDVNDIRQQSRSRTTSVGSEEKKADIEMSPVRKVMPFQSKTDNNSIRSIRAFADKSFSSESDDSVGNSVNAEEKEDKRVTKANTKYASVSHSSSDHDPDDETNNSPVASMKQSTWHRMRTLNNLFTTKSNRLLPPSSSSSAPPKDLEAKAMSMSDLGVSPQTSSSSTTGRMADGRGRRALKSAHTFDEIANSIQNQDVLEKLQKAKDMMESRQLQEKVDANNRATFLLTSKQAMQSLMRNVYFFCFAAW